MFGVLLPGDAPTTGPGLLRGGRRLAAAAALVLLTAATWPAWSVWSGSAPLAPWQLAGIAVTVALLAILAPRRLPGWLVGVLMPVSFTVAWSVTAQAADDSGLWAVGALLMLVGGIVAAAVLVPLGVALRPVRWPEILLRP